MTDPKTSATWAEIMAQPAIWRDWARPLAARAAEIRDWIAARGIERIWLSGAGTSAFIGETLAAGDARLEPVPTTDIVAAPGDWLSRKERILALQFGRSGNSSESVGLLDLLDAHRPDIDRLHVTCNPEGALATRQAPGPGEARALTLPVDTHDAGFAMTSSYTTMMLTALACLTEFDAQSALPRLAGEAERLLSEVAERPAPRPERAIFLGSGALKGVARESALKVLELTAGQTMTQWDSALGFRHGPKAAVDGATQVYVLIHPAPHTARYDRDMAEEIRRQFPEITVTTIGPGGDIALEGTGEARADAVLYVLAAQVLATRWSGALDLNIDDPFEGRNLSRVVSGVTLYDYAS